MELSLKWLGATLKCFLYFTIESDRIPQNCENGEADVDFGQRILGNGIIATTGKELNVTLAREHVVMWSLAREHVSNTRSLSKLTRISQVFLSNMLKSCFKQ